MHAGRSSRVGHLNINRFAAAGPRHQNGGSSVQISTETEYLKTAKKGGGHKGNTGIIEYFDSLLRLLFH